MSDVSVAMATFNGGRFLARQLASIAEQTMRPQEIVVCDDGSTDNTLEIIESFSKTCGIPVRLERNEVRLGYADNFMKAAGLTSSRYISFADQDDYWYPTKIDKSIRALIENNAMLVSHHVRMIDCYEKSLGIVTQEIDATSEFPSNKKDPWGFFLGFSETFDRRLLEIIPCMARGLDSNTFAKILPHDRWLYFLGTHFGVVVGIKECLADYQQHENNTYGITRKTLSQRFQIKVQEGPARLKQFEELAACRVDMLTLARAAPFLAEFDRAIRRWESVRTHCRRRYDLYVSPGFGRRGALLLGNIAGGTYRGFAADGLGPKRLLEDVTLGLFGKMLGPWP